jgi:hypothetical protein
VNRVANLSSTLGIDTNDNSSNNSNNNNSNIFDCVYYHIKLIFTFGCGITVGFGTLAGLAAAGPLVGR